MAKKKKINYDWLKVVGEAIKTFSCPCGSKELVGVSINNSRNLYCKGCGTKFNNGWKANNKLMKKYNIKLVSKRPSKEGTTKLEYVQDKTSYDKVCIPGEKFTKKVKTTERKIAKSYKTKSYFVSDNSKTKKINGYVTEITGKLVHREVYTKNFGAIPKNHHIHHIDGNKTNNTPKNLVALPNDFHYLFHSYKRSLGTTYQHNLVENKKGIYLLSSFYSFLKNSNKLQNNT